MRYFCITPSPPSRDLLTLTLSHMLSFMHDNLEHPTVIRSSVMNVGSHFQYLTTRNGHCACAVSSIVGGNDPHLKTPDPDLSVYFVTFVELRQNCQSRNVTTCGALYRVAQKGKPLPNDQKLY